MWSTCSFPLTPACPGTQQKLISLAHPILKNTLKISFTMSGQALDFPTLKVSKSAAESEQIITSLGLASSIHHKAHRTAINSVLKKELPFEIRRSIFNFNFSTYTPNPARSIFKNNHTIPTNWVKISHYSWCHLPLIFFLKKTKLSFQFRKHPTGHMLYNTTFIQTHLLYPLIYLNKEILYSFLSTSHVQLLVVYLMLRTYQKYVFGIIEFYKGHMA